MTLKIAYFQPTILAMDTIPPVEFSKLYSLTESVHGHTELNEANNRHVSIRGGQQIQMHPSQLNLDIGWLIHWLETICTGYMEIVCQQSGNEDLRLCKPLISRIWTVRQSAGDYQELHTNQSGHLSGNLYISSPEKVANSASSDGQESFVLPHSRDLTKFVTIDTWKYDPTPGTVILFPSHLPHAVYPWKGIGTRTVVSFDAQLVPKE